MVVATEVAAVTERAERIRDWNLDAVMIYTGAKHLDWGLFRLRRAELGYRQFVFLRGLYAGQDDIRLVPHVDVDEVWHSHLLHTRDYAAMCEHVLGHFMHHTPSPGGKPTEQDRQDYVATRALLRRHFGAEHDPAQWLAHTAA